MAEFEIRRAADGDRDAIVRLVSAMHRRDVADRWRWIYRDNPHGKAVSWLALERASGEAVAVTSMFPRRVLVDGRVRAGSIGGDCYVLPRARRRGLATRLHRAGLEGMRAAGIDLMYGPPLPNNLAALLKAGSHQVADFRRYLRPIAGSMLVARLPSAPAAVRTALELAAAAPLALLNRAARWTAGGVQLEPVEAFGPEFDRLCERVSPSYRILPVRDRAYLAWRYLQGPLAAQTPLAARRGGELVGFVAVEQRERHASLVDLLAIPGPEYDGVLAALIGWLLEREIASVDTRLITSSPAAARLPRGAFVSRESVGFQVAVADDDPQVAILRHGAAWHFTDGDADMDTVYETPPV